MWLGSRCQRVDQVPRPRLKRESPIRSAPPYRPDVDQFLTEDRFESASGDFNLQSDPLTQNRYAFAGGNPVNRIEFDGHHSGNEGGAQNNMRSQTRISPLAAA
jgi:hypothetical protein